MGRLVEGHIPQIFNGVSRQPHPVRYPGQVQDAENVVFSVETGGFYKRLGTRIKKKLTGLPSDEPSRLHIINRDANERYRVVLSRGSLNVYDEDYVERAVNADAANLAWLDEEPSKFVLLSALDYTFIVKTNQTVAMSSDVAPAAPSMAVLYVAATPDITAASTYIVKIDGTQRASYTASLSDDDTNDIADNLRSQLSSNLGVGWSISRSGPFVFIEKDNGSSFAVTTDSPRGDTSIVTTQNIVGDTSKAPARALDGMVLEVKGTFDESFWIKFEANNGTSGDGFWSETVSPGSHIKLDAETMPRALVRNGDGTFTLDVIDWAEKKVGDDVLIPDPDFVGQPIRDLLFTRNRLGVVSGENVFFTQSGDYFNFWPETVTEVVASDPFGMENTTNSVSKFFFAVPFRRSTFIMGDTAQFEIGGSMLTPTEASIDLATSYTASAVCRPVAVGDELYFSAEVGKVASIMSYVFDEASVSETAEDITKHVEGYIPSPVVEMLGDPLRGQLTVLSDADRSSLYVHRFYYQGAERVQSAWGKYVFDGATIRSIGLADGVTVMVIDWRDEVWLVELPSVEDIYSDFEWTPRLDMHEIQTGTYDSETDTTSWTVSYDIVDPVVVTSSAFPENYRMIDVVATADGTTVSAKGDWSGHPVMIGENFDSWVELSKQFLRNESGSSITTGRLQLRRMGLRYTNSGYFTVTVTPQGRPSFVSTFTGRLLGSALNRIQRFPILSGTFSAPVRSNGETATIRVGSNKFTPFSIVSAVWTGFFNEITRQG